MSNFAWANPTNGLREQSDSLTGAVDRIQKQLNDPKAEGLHSVVLYEQSPRLTVERNHVFTAAPRESIRLWDWLRLKLHRKPDQIEGWHDGE